MLSLEQMLSSSVHLGHQVKQWNPKMSPYIYGERNGIHVIDLLQTLICLEKACKFLVLFVCTKKQFTDIVESCALETGSHFVTQRWLGGMLTNWSTIKICISNLQLEKYFSGIKNMSSIPDVVILIGQNREINAVKECLKLGVTLISILDTNCDPTLTDYLIPANDDSVSSVSIILKQLSSAIIS
uniref:ribosomal protein S2 n=1 Tax=Strombomonas costata TaxID=161230 RepID=UPI0023AB31D1|nr:ribosomal protein S2 [Strombomonas costata]WCH63608.1 ribosomal protein S2 [Strombomonas costata]